jgi:hypothetical protein
MGLPKLVASIEAGVFGSIEGVQGNFEDALREEARGGVVYHPDVNVAVHIADVQVMLFANLEAPMPPAVLFHRTLHGFCERMSAAARRAPNVATVVVLCADMLRCEGDVVTFGDDHLREDLLRADGVDVSRAAITYELEHCYSTTERADALRRWLEVGVHAQSSTLRDLKSTTRAQRAARTAAVQRARASVDGAAGHAVAPYPMGSYVTNDGIWLPGAMAPEPVVCLDRLRESRRTHAHSGGSIHMATPWETFLSYCAKRVHEYDWPPHVRVATLLLSGVITMAAGVRGRAEPMFRPHHRQHNLVEALLSAPPGARSMGLVPVGGMGAARHFAEADRGIVAPVVEHYRTLWRTSERRRREAESRVREAHGSTGGARPALLQADLERVQRLHETRVAQDLNRTSYHLHTTDQDVLATLMASFWGRSFPRLFWHAARHGSDHATGVVWSAPALANHLRVAGLDADTFVACCVLNGCDFFDRSTVFRGVGEERVWAAVVEMASSDSLRVAFDRASPFESFRKLLCALYAQLCGAKAPLRKLTKEAVDAAFKISTPKRPSASSSAAASAAAAAAVAAEASGLTRRRPTPPADTPVVYASFLRAFLYMRDDFA